MTHAEINNLTLSVKTSSVYTFARISTQETTMSSYVKTNKIRDLLRAVFIHADVVQSQRPGNG